MGWHTRKKYWNQGLATEAALACRDLAISRFGLDRLIGIINPKNRASIRVAENLGMKRGGEIVMEGYPQAIYAIERHE